MRTITSIIGLFLSAIILVLLAIAIITSVYAFLTWDSGCYQTVISNLDPRDHTYIRVLLFIWACASIFFGAILGELG